MLKITVVILLGLFSSSFAFQCKSTPPLLNFDIDQLYGNWFEIERIPQDYQTTRNLYCGSALYDKFDNNDGIIHTYSHFHYIKGTGSRVQNSGYMNTTSGLKNELEISFGKIINSLPPFVSYNYNVWSFDIRSHLLVYTCDGKNEYATIFARGKTLNPTTLQSLKDLLARRGVDVSRLEKARVLCPGE